MAKDTKSIVADTLINILEKKEKVTISEISTQSYITRATIIKNFDNGLNGIVEYIYSAILDRINNELFKHDPDELTVEEFADIVLPIIWDERRKIKVLYSSHLTFKPSQNASNLSWKWVEKRYNKLVKMHNFTSIFSGQELLTYWNSHLFAVLFLWLSPDSPLAPSEFRPKFLFLMDTSIASLIYKGI